MNCTVSKIIIILYISVILYTGIGKYSEVYAGKDVVTGQEVALKILDRRRLPSEDGPKDEYKKLSELCHRNIVSGLALFTESPKEYLDTIVMTRYVYHKLDYILFIFL